MDVDALTKSALAKIGTASFGSKTSPTTPLLLLVLYFTSSNAMTSSEYDPTSPLLYLPNDIATTDEDVVSVTTDTPEYKNMAVQTDPSDITPPPDSKESTWTCRLPSELMGLVLDCLVEDEALGTLGDVQQTSRAMYSLTTPYLYRNIIVHQYQALNLFGLFHTFPRGDNRLFLCSVPAIHPLDLHLPHRLRVFFSHTQKLEFHLENLVAVESFAYPYDSDPLDRFKEVVNSLSGLCLPTLWPAIKRCTLDLKVVSYSHIRLYNGSQSSSDDLPNLAKAVFTDIHPRYFTINFPGHGKKDDEPMRECEYQWEECFETLRTDHAEITNLTPGYTVCGPHATFSMYVLFKKPSLGDDGEIIETRVDKDETLYESHVFTNLNHLYLVGIPRPGDMTNAGNPRSVNDVYDDIASCEQKFMRARLNDGNQQDLKIIIQPDISSNDLATATSWIYKQPKKDE
jgi:hypothetical protein